MKICDGYETKHDGIEIIFNNMLESECPLCKIGEKLSEKESEIDGLNDRWNDEVGLLQNDLEDAKYEISRLNSISNSV